MHITILAVGHAKATPQGELIDEFLDRARRLGRQYGFTSVEAVELPVSKARSTELRKADEAERIVAHIPAGATVIRMDEHGKPQASEQFAHTIAHIRDDGAQHLIFIIGGPDGLGKLPMKTPSRMMAFGPQTWPHLLVRAMLAEQIYRAITILAGHPYHRA